MTCEQSVKFPTFLLRVMAAAVGVLLLLAAGLILFIKFYPEYYTVGTYELPGGYEVTIEGESSWEYQQCFYYSISQGGREVVPRTFHSAIDERTEFAILDSDRGVFALASTSNPRDVLIMFDTKTKASWPRMLSEKNSHAQEMLRTLRANPAYAQAELTVL